MSKSKKAQPARKQISVDKCCEAVNLVMQKMGERLEVKGYGSFMSSHEVLGILIEEFHELIEAVRANNPDELHEELLDLAVGAVFSLACLRSGGLEW